MAKKRSRRRKAVAVKQRRRRGQDTPVEGRDDQAGFRTPDWQIGEQEATKDIAEGRTDFFESGKAFVAALWERRSQR